MGEFKKRIKLKGKRYEVIKKPAFLHRAKIRYRKRPASLPNALVGGDSYFKAKRANLSRKKRWALKIFQLLLVIRKFPESINF
jgi:hypothetical protein